MKRKTYALSNEKGVILTLTELGKGVVTLDFGDVDPDVNDPKLKEWMQNVVFSLARKAQETGYPLRVIHHAQEPKGDWFCPNCGNIEAD